MGNMEIGKYSCLIEDILKNILQKCLFSSPLLFISILFISLNMVDCQGDKKGNFS